MNSIEWARNAMLLCIVVSLVMARWSTVRMTNEINQRVPDGDRMPVKWFSNHNDRRVLKRYRFEISNGHLHFLYFGCMVAAAAFLVAGIVLGVHSA